MQDAIPWLRATEAREGSEIQPRKGFDRCRSIGGRATRLGSVMRELRGVAGFRQEHQHDQ